MPVAPVQGAAVAYSVLIHFLIGALTGYAFPVRALLGLVAVVLIECFIAALVFGVTAGLASLMGLVAIQLGYLCGIYARSVLEKAGLAASGSPVKYPH